jgi:hypothetical protein
MIGILPASGKAERLKGIPAYRQAFRFKDGETLPVKQEKWAMKRLGIRDNYVLKVEPTSRLCKRMFQ